MYLLTKEYSKIYPPRNPRLRHWPILPKPQLDQAK
ncbi:MAG: hypothetical protein ACI9ND_003008, partial [Yoonia sp.]